jgi:hypothetical protein
LKASSIVINGNTLTVTLPLTTTNSVTAPFPSSGQAVNRWTVVFYPRIPAQNPNFTDVASLVPQHTNFQLFYPPPKHKS